MAAAQGDAEMLDGFDELRGVKRDRGTVNRIGQKRNRKHDEAAADEEEAELEWRGATGIDCKRRNAENRIS